LQQQPSHPQRFIYPDRIAVLKRYEVMAQKLDSAAEIRSLGMTNPNLNTAPLGMFPHCFGPLFLATLTLTAVLIATLVVGGPELGTKSQQITVVKDSAGGLELKEIFEFKLTDYKANVAKFEANLKLQAFLILISLLLVLRRSDTIDVFNNKVPLHWLHVMLPLATLFVWLEFGFLLDDLIEGRIRLVAMMKSFGTAHSIHAQSLLHDAGFIDGWTMTFIDKEDAETGHGTYSGIDLKSNRGTAFFLVSVLGTWVALSHASVLAMTAIGIRRYLNAEIRMLRRMYYCLPMLPLLIFILSHWQFAYGGNNPNWMQVYVAFAAIPALAYLLWLSVKVDQSAERTSLRCLLRRNDVKLAGENLGIDGLGESHSHLRVVLLGDSLSTGFYVGSYPGMLYRMLFQWQGSWFVGNQSICGVTNRLAEISPIVVSSYACATAKIKGAKRRSLADWVTGTYHLGHQVSEVEINGPPDLAVIWIGHNNLDWASESDDAVHAETVATKLVKMIEQQLNRLVKSMGDGLPPRVIMVFGLVNFEAFFEARELAAVCHNVDNSKFPYFGRCYRFYVSMQPEYRCKMIEIAKAFNLRLQILCNDLNRKSAVNVIYSDALAKAGLNNASMLSSSDAWHPSEYGHQCLADAAWPHIESTIAALMLKREKTAFIKSCESDLGTANQ